jgi:hypothetical protein
MSRHGVAQRLAEFREFGVASYEPCAGDPCRRRVRRAMSDSWLLAISVFSAVYIGASWG